VRNAYKILGGKSEGKIPLGTSMCMPEDNNIRMDLKHGGKLWTGFI
jgi:hypothetical protein